MLSNQSIFFKSQNDPAILDAKTNVSQEQNVALDLNEQLRREIENKPNYIKYLIGEKAINTFLKNTEKKLDIHSYEILHAKMVKAGQMQCSDYADPCIDGTMMVVGGAIMGAGVGGVGALASAVLCCNYTSSQVLAFTIVFGGTGAVIGGCVGGCVGPDTEPYDSLKQTRQDIAAYAKEFQPKYLKLIAPETQKMEEVPLLRLHK